jgi:hypothetical protein
MVNIRAFKDRVSSKYLNASIAEILRNEPDEVGPEELIGKLATWQTIIDSERK